jgi:hypothetical protein
MSLTNLAHHESSVANFYYSKGYLEVRFKENVIIGEKEMHELFRIREELTGGQRYVLLTDGTLYHHVLPEARQMIARVSHKNRIAHAYVTRNLTVTIMARMYILKNRPLTPTRIFKTISNARNWLLTYQVEEDNNRKSISILPDCEITEHMHVEMPSIVNIEGIVPGINDLVMVHENNDELSRFQLSSSTYTVSKRIEQEGRLWFEYADCDDCHELIVTLNAIKI